MCILEIEIRVTERNIWGFMAVVKAAAKLPAGNFLTICATVNFSERAVLLEINFS
jgi:hypothetical protein